MAVRDAFRTQSRMGGGRAAPGPGVQGTMGGAAPASTAGAAPGKRAIILGDEVYLWVLIALELAIIAWLRSTFSRYHGG